VNQGQLKHVLMPFYDHLNTLGYTNGYPWSDTTADDRSFAAANIGQTKQVFQFGLDAWLPLCTWVETSHYRINAGGTNYIDGSGHVWAADDFYTAGGTFSTSSSIANTTDDELYQTERFGDFGYVFPVSNGYNTVQLHFAEIYWTQTGQRVFDVFMEGSNVFDDVDIWEIADKDVAYTKEFVVSVSDCQLDIDFVSVVDNAKI
jgi:hypothetical protein